MFCLFSIDAKRIGFDFRKPYDNLYLYFPKITGKENPRFQPSKQICISTLPPCFPSTYIHIASKYSNHTWQTTRPLAQNYPLSDHLMYDDEAVSGSISLSVQLHSLSRHEGNAVYLSRIFVAIESNISEHRNFTKKYFSKHSNSHIFLVISLLHIF